MSTWQGPRPTPSWIGMRTPFPYLDQSWQIAVALLDEGRRAYHQGDGLGCVPDVPGGRPGAWLPVSLGPRGPMPFAWDPRDIRHAAKCMSYLWAEEEGLAEEFTRNMLLEDCQPGAANSYACIAGMYALGAADTLYGFGVKPASADAVLAAAWDFLATTVARFDPEGSGLLNVGMGNDLYGRGFWGTFLGEPNHMPPAYDGRNKLVTAGMGNGGLRAKSARCGESHRPPEHRAVRATLPPIDGRHRRAGVESLHPILLYSTRRQQRALVPQHDRPE